MEEPIKSRPYGAAPQACERCVFGRGEHAEFCQVQLVADHIKKSLNGACWEFRDWEFKQ